MLVHYWPVKMLSVSSDIQKFRTLRPRVGMTGFSEDIQERSFLTYLVKQNEYIFDNILAYKLLRLGTIKKNNNISSSCS